MGDFLLGSYARAAVEAQLCLTFRGDRRHGEKIRGRAAAVPTGTAMEVPGRAAEAGHNGKLDDPAVRISGGFSRHPRHGRL